MKKLVAIISLLFISLTAAAQEKTETPPDYPAIEKSSKDKASPYFFDKLFTRFNAADTTMTTEERRHLYYGYSFTDKYSPYANAEEVKEINTILNKQDFTEAEMKKVIALSGKALEVYPFNIRMMQYRRYFYEKLGMMKEAIAEDSKIGIVLEAILSTGRGDTAENAIYVIEVSNEYQILGVLGFEFGGEQSLVKSRYDYLKLKDNEYGLKGMYFDVSRSLDSFKK